MPCSSLPRPCSFTCHLRLPSTRRPILPRPKRLPPPIRPPYPIRHRLSPRRHRWPAPAPSPSAPTSSSEIDTETSGAAASSSTQQNATPPNRKHKKGTHRPRDEQDKGAALRAGWKWQGARNESFRVGATLPAVASEAVVVSATVSSASGSSPATFLRAAVLAAALAILLLAVTPTFALDASRVLRPVGELALRACHDRPQHSGRYRRRKGASHMTRRLASAAVLVLGGVASHHGKRGWCNAPVVSDRLHLPADAFLNDATPTICGLGKRARAMSRSRSGLGATCRWLRLSKRQPRWTVIFGRSSSSPPRRVSTRSLPARPTWPTTLARARRRASPSTRWSLLSRSPHLPPTPS